MFRNEVTTYQDDNLQMSISHILILWGGKIIEKLVNEFNLVPVRREWMRQTELLVATSLFRETSFLAFAHYFFVDAYPPCLGVYGFRRQLAHVTRD